MEQLHVNSPENMFPVDFYVSSFHFEADSVSQMILLWSSKVFCFHLSRACKGTWASMVGGVEDQLFTVDLCARYVTPTYHTIPYQTKPNQTIENKPHESSGSVTAAHKPCARYVHLHLLLLDNTTNSPTELRVIFLIFVIIV